MRIYVAAPFELKDEVIDLYTLLLAHGHIITGDWTTHKHIGHPIREVALARDYAEEDIEAIKSAEVLILLGADHKSTGSHLELGAALGLSKPVYLLGEISHEHMFYYHPLIHCVTDTDHSSKF